MSKPNQDNKTIRYSARGKLMITGEYLALKGARSLAWPTLSKHHLELTSLPGSEGNLIWNALDMEGKPWFDALFDTTNGIDIINASDEKVAYNLTSILHAAISLKGRNILQSASFQIETSIEWPMQWGMGSSSSLLVNIASWFQINPFELQQKTIGGSGYDIACALSDQPIIFQKSDQLMAARVHRPEILCEHGGLAYLGNKANTSYAIKNFEEKTKNIDLRTRIDLINRLTYHILDAKSVEHLIKAIEIHEETIGYLLDRDPIKKRQFQSFDGAVKSLGAWGGDFVLFVGKEKFEKFKLQTEEQFGIKLYSIKDLLV